VRSQSLCIEIPADSYMTDNLGLEHTAYDIASKRPSVRSDAGNRGRPFGANSLNEGYSLEEAQLGSAWLRGQADY
jgi:hypothetical protein